MIPKVFEPLPCRAKHDGWAFVGDVNFPGPGWSNDYRTRPTNFFDLASKLHDAAFEINLLHVNPTGHRNRQAQSRKEKADMMFRTMNSFKPEHYWSWSSKWNWASKQIFDGTEQEKFRDDDGYLSVFHPHYLRQFSDPTNYLMIPYSELPQDQRPTIDDSDSSIFGQIGGYSRNVLHQNYGQHDYTKEVKMDRAEPFPDWLKRVYGPIWSQLIEIGGVDNIPDDGETVYTCSS